VSGNFPSCTDVTQAAGFHVLKTITIRFLNPRKLGAASESWLRHDVLGLECTAAMCLYLFSQFLVGWPLSCVLWLVGTLPFTSDGSSDGTSLLVDMAVPIIVVMVPELSFLRAPGRRGRLLRSVSVSRSIEAI